MVQSLVDYVKKEVAQGYSVEQIRAALIKYGYSQAQIETALQQYNQQLNSKGKVKQTTKVKPKTKSNFSFNNFNYKKVGIIIGAIVLLLILISMINFLLEEKETTQETSELTLNIESIQTTISPGQDISFLKRISFNGITKLNLAYTLTDKQNNIILTDYETLDVENSITSKTEIKTSNIEPGQYTLNIIAKYNNEEIKKEMNVKVFEESEQP
ncbi:MAG: hypothetical protein KAQ83_01610, partial [Nanoarchaeota archaeon]|nr:hypothetical protein [Nanoarchaeota archaeon]